MLFEQFDLPILKFVTSLGGRSEYVDNIIGCISRFDTFKGVAMMALLWAAWFHNPPNETAEQRDKRQQQVLITFVGSIVAVVISRVMQRLITVHSRPALANLGLQFPTYPDSLPMNMWSSFPSDHTMLFCALATGLWQINRRMGYLAFFWAFVVVSLPRIYLGFHYPSDVLSGVIFGIIAMWAFEKLPVHNLAARTLAWQKTYPGWFFALAFLATDALAHLFDDMRFISSALLRALHGG